jgi:hypothetical protein
MAIVGLKLNEHAPASWLFPIRLTPELAYITGDFGGRCTKGPTVPDVAAKPLWLNLITPPATNLVLAN